MKKVKIIPVAIGTIVFVILIAVGCKKAVTPDVKAENSEQSMFKMTSTTPTISAALKNKIQSTFGKIKRLKMQDSQIRTMSYDIGVNQELLNFDFPNFVSYEGTSIAAVLFDQGNGTTFVCFSENGLVADMGAFISTESLSSTKTRNYFYNLDHQLVAQVDSENETLSDIYTYNPTPINSTNGWLSRWYGCLTQNLNDMVYKQPLVGVACLYFGPACATGLLTGCAAAATFH
jgi:hypothetical protein